MLRRERRYAPLCHSRLTAPAGAAKLVRAPNVMSFAAAGHFGDAMKYARYAAVLVALALAPPARADVVVNEIMYHAPNDLDDLQFVELHNTGGAAVDLSGWKIK